MRRRRRKKSKKQKKKSKKKKKKSKSKKSKSDSGEAVVECTEAELKKATAYRKEHQIGVESPPELGLPKCLLPFQLLDDLATKMPKKSLTLVENFTTPTPIQSQCWPLALSGHDVIGIAETGSGKTLAFLMPALRMILERRPHPNKSGETKPLVLVLAPTRELASQIHQVCEEANRCCGVRSTLVYGGVPSGPQVRELRAGVDILVATPGRLLGLCRNKSVKLNEVCYLVLDEADRMLDLGFEPDVRAIMEQTLSSRQTLLFSATWPDSVRKLGMDFVTRPVKVTIGDDDELTANKRIHQIVEVVDENDKPARLWKMLGKYYNKKEKNRIIIFVLYKKEAARVERMIQGRGYTVVAIHGDKQQNDRTSALEEFKQGRIPILVATDVAARGLDIPHVDHVINYSFPLTVEDYVHRIGRTGRAGKNGLSHTLFTIRDKKLAGELVNVLKESGNEVPQSLSAFGVTLKRKKKHSLYGDHYGDTDAITKKSSHIRFD